MRAGSETCGKFLGFAERRERRRRVSISVLELRADAEELTKLETCIERAEERLPGRESLLRGIDCALTVVQARQVGEDDALGALISHHAMDSEGRLVMRLRQLQFAAILMQAAQGRDDLPLQTPIAQLPLDRQGGFERRACLLDPLLRVVQETQVDEHNAFGKARPCLAMNDERRLEMGTGIVHPALIEAEAAEIAVGVALEGGGFPLRGG